MRKSNSIDPFSFMKDADHLDKELQKKELYDSVILREFFAEKFDDPEDSDQDLTDSTQSGFRKRFSLLRKNTHKRSIQAIIKAQRLIDQSKKDAQNRKENDAEQKENLLTDSDPEAEDDFGFLQKPDSGANSDDEALNSSGVFSAGDSDDGASSDDSYIRKKSEK